MIKFSYEPFKNKFISLFGASHSQQIKDHINFDNYIRGTILDDTLYLRTYYPFSGIQELSMIDINRKSKVLLVDYLKEIDKHLEKHNMTYRAVVFNATKDLFYGKGLRNI
jgi:hypothetical protein